MEYPPLLNLCSAAEYRTYFENLYCHGPIITFDGIEVRFRKRDFNHAFFESNNIKDDTFSPIRAQRVLWIKAALEDPEAKLFVGWDKKKKKPAHNRRVAVVMGNYVVIIHIKNQKKADFITAYLADSGRTLNLILSGQPWT